MNHSELSHTASASEMTYIVSGGALNSTHSLRLRWQYYKYCVVIIIIIIIIITGPPSDPQL